MTFNGLERAEQIATAAGSTGKVVAYQLGARYPRFAGVSREALALVFEGHSFPRAAAEIRAIDDRKALSEAISRRAKPLCEQQSRATRNGSGTSKVKFVVRELETAQDHMRAWGIVREERKDGERGAHYTVGARVFVSPAGIFAAAPVDSPSDPDCETIAREIARYAQWLLVNADTPDASKALTTMYSESGALGFIARGTYLAPVGRPGTAQVVAAIEEIYKHFYSEVTRSGIRARAIAVTEHDQSAVCDSVIDDFEARAAELCGFLKGEAGRSNVRESTIASRFEAAKNFLNDLAPAKDLIGNWFDRFEKIGQAIRDAYAQAVDGLSLQLPEEIKDVTDPDAEPELPAANVLPQQPTPAPEPEPAPVSEPASEHDSDLSHFEL